MTPTGTSDRAVSFMLARQNRAIRQDMARLTQEMTTGRVADPSAHLSGRTAQLSALTTDLSRLDAYQTAGRDLRHRQTLVQATLGTVGDTAQALSQRLVAASFGADAAETGRIAQSARDGLSASLAALNIHDQGLAVFGGTEQVPAAFAETDVILNDIAASIIGAGAVTATDVRAAIDDWFDTPGGGFETVAYHGAGTLAQRRVADGTFLPAGPQGDDTALRETLKGMAIVTLSDRPDIALTNAERANLIGSAQSTLIEAGDQLIGLRAEVGLAQEQLDLVESRNAARTDSLRQLEAALIGADPFETASALQAVQLQLETQYALTARLSRLSLLEYIR